VKNLFHYGGFGGVPIRAADVGLLLLRLGAGGLLAVTHGWATARGLVEAPGEFPDPVGLGALPSQALAAFAELVCAAAVALGLWTRLCALPLVVNFTVAVFVFHAGDSFARRELAVHFLVAFAALAATGGGQLSIDGWRAHWRRGHS
jgi:putative oxidoreductase